MAKAKKTLKEYLEIVRTIKTEKEKNKQANLHDSMQRVVLIKFISQGNNDN